MFTGAASVIPSGPTRYAGQPAPRSSFVIGSMLTAVSDASAPGGNTMVIKPSPETIVPPAAPIVVVTAGPVGVPTAVGRGASRVGGGGGSSAQPIHVTNTERTALMEPPIEHSEHTPRP